MANLKQRKRERDVYNDKDIPRQIDGQTDRQQKREKKIAGCYRYLFM